MTAAPGPEPAAPHPIGPSRRALLGLVGVACAAVAARVMSPGFSDGFWIDEVQSVDTARSHAAVLLTRSGLGDVHPPGYYVLLSLWLALGDLFGVVAGPAADPWARLLSALASGAGVVALGLWIRRTGGGALPSLAAAVALAASPFAAHYGVEVRAYALATALGVALAASAARFHRTGAGLPWVVALATGLCLTHYYGVLVALGIGAHGLATHARGPQARRWIGALAATAGLASWWIPLTLVQALDLPDAMTAHLAASLPPADIARALGPLPSLGLGASATAGGLVLLLAAVGAATSPRAGSISGAWRGASVAADAGRLPRALWGVAITSALVGPMIPFAALQLSEVTFDVVAARVTLTYGVLAGLLAALAVADRLWRPAPGAGSRSPRLPAPAWVLLALALGVGVLSLKGPTLSLRNLLVATPFVLALATAGASRVHALAPAALAACYLAGAALAWPTSHELFEPRAQFREAIGALEAEAPPGGPSTHVVAVPPWDAPALARYAERLTPRGVASVDALALEDLDERARLHVVMSRDLEDEEAAAVARRVLEASLGPELTLTVERRLRGVRTLTFEPTPR